MKTNQPSATLLGYKQIVKSYLEDAAAFDEKPLSGKKAAFKNDAAKRDAFERMALPHIDALYGVAMRLTKESGEAENLVQDVFLRAFRFFDRYTMGTNIRAWLFRMLYNTFINHYHVRVRMPVTVDSDLVDTRCEDEAQKCGYCSPTEECVFLRHIDSKVVRAVESLPTDFRLPVLLSDVQQMPYDEISRALDIPVGTVKSRIHRGRRALRTLLADYGRACGYAA